MIELMILILIPALFCLAGCVIEEGAKFIVKHFYANHFYRLFGEKL